MNQPVPDDPLAKAGLETTAVRLAVGRPGWLTALGIGLGETLRRALRRSPALLSPRRLQCLVPALAIGLGLLALPITAAPMALIALATRLETPGPALFRQRCTGFCNRDFEMLKFRTMFHNMSDAEV